MYNQFYRKCGVYLTDLGISEVFGEIDLDNLPNERLERIGGYMENNFSVLDDLGKLNFIFGFSFCLYKYDIGDKKIFRDIETVMYSILKNVFDFVFSILKFVVKVIVVAFLFSLFSHHSDER